jgi:hypothetical protein
MSARGSIRGRRVPLPRVEQLLPLACLAAAALLFASEFMTTFEFRPPGREALAEQTAADRHGYGLAVIAALAFVATLAAVLFASKPAAVSVGACGVIALLVFLIVDLPDVNAVGTLDDGRQSFFDAEAVPQMGFWLELVGALSLTVSGVALATLSSDQLAALRPRGSPTGGVEPGLEGERPAAVPAQSADGASTGERERVFLGEGGGRGDAEGEAPTRADRQSEPYQR